MGNGVKNGKKSGECHDECRKCYMICHVKLGNVIGYGNAM